MALRSVVVGEEFDVDKITLVAAFSKAFSSSFGGGRVITGGEFFQKGQGGLRISAVEKGDDDFAGVDGARTPQFSCSIYELSHLRGSHSHQEDAHPPGGGPIAVIQDGKQGRGLVDGPTVEFVEALGGRGRHQKLEPRDTERLLVVPGAQHCQSGAPGRFDADGVWRDDLAKGGEQVGYEVDVV